MGGMLFSGICTVLSLSSATAACHSAGRELSALSLMPLSPPGPSLLRGQGNHSSFLEQLLKES